jgi:hypothetical protein
MESQFATGSVPPLPRREVGSRSDPGEGLSPIEGPYPLTPTLSPWERERTYVVAIASPKSEEK